MKRDSLSYGSYELHTAPAANFIDLGSCSAVDYVYRTPIEPYQYSRCCYESSNLKARDGVRFLRYYPNGLIVPTNENLPSIHYSYGLYGRCGLCNKFYHVPIASYCRVCAEPVGFCCVTPLRLFRNEDELQ